jgi:hypothetical protein
VPEISQRVPIEHSFRGLSLLDLPGFLPGTATLLHASVQQALQAFTVYLDGRIATLTTTAMITHTDDRTPDPWAFRASQTASFPPS